MKPVSDVGRVGGLLVLGLAAAEVLIMISPFAGFFYATLGEPVLGFLSQSPLTAWLDGFFLNHAVVTTSTLLEWNRKAGLVLLVLGLGGFFVSAVQVYGNKIAKRGVATGLLYRFVRHPQYLCLAIAGWGLLVLWPRFLLFGILVTMLFLYAGLARYEEYRMEKRFGDEYRRLLDTRGSFLPGSPVHKLFGATFGRLRPRALGWAAAYVFCLAAVFSTAFGLRAYTRLHTAILYQPEDQAVVVSAWPKPKEWMATTFQAAMGHELVQRRLREGRGANVLVVTILPPRYGMKGMYYQAAPDRNVSREGGSPLMGVDPDTTAEPVEVVFSRAEKPYKDSVTLQEALDPDIRLTPLVVASYAHAAGRITDVHVPLPQNRWGPNIVMPVF
jgi:protein-S-isoprenylcysteine O-methyltransferase Ste14